MHSVQALYCNWDCHWDCLRILGFQKSVIYDSFLKWHSPFATKFLPFVKANRAATSNYRGNPFAISQHRRNLSYVFKPLNKGFVLLCCLYIIINLYLHKHFCTSVQSNFKQHCCRSGEWSAAIQDVVQHFVRNAHLFCKFGLLNVSIFYFFLMISLWWIGQSWKQIKPAE